MLNDDLYRQEILEHYRSPQNYGKLRNYTLKAEKINELCGDEITLRLLISPRLKGPASTRRQGEGVRGGWIKDVKFSGAGCALSIASASLFTESLKGKSFTQVTKITQAQVIKKLGIKVGPTRKKCVLLVFETLQTILKNDKRKHSKKTKRYT
ncbi:MAG: Fe-S cluster protein [Candidatus Doudnabacteria bacterium CG10_big_fil_rev_8_21_14_0_10_41_10]|uniref:Fe-S cluster protein n=1 Tax=Candidatus Doudnabacteria bacterium CG10_big_fil_rev_8_21_14_0_10_41_10 TaxID=1974551 RepID=A0A2H0VD99_9BACT|nr:MAG: Fe-S cluster protein [Candidatus Doudnabacteria bacterium CG10_big_fil_rev_8_21_14_0_10_41_10]